MQKKERQTFLGLARNIGQSVGNMIFKYIVSQHANKLSLLLNTRTNTPKCPAQMEIHLDYEDGHVFSLFSITYKLLFCNSFSSDIPGYRKHLKYTSRRNNCHAK